ncbi:MAG TPA: ribose-5-phosphate isomerase RpiA [Kofleriaceae bacterium]|jgi:ribose 5-phosphate isomerase A
MTPRDEAKRAAARAALAELPDAGVVGIGTGSTAAFFIEALAEAIAGGRRYTGVPTSQASRAAAAARGIALLDDAGPWDIAVTVDGADEVDDELNLIKGGGGALTREKIVNYSSRRNVIVVDAVKRSRRLGERWAVPVEVLRFGQHATAAHLARLGTPVLRVVGGEQFATDAGNVIYDVACGPIARPAELDAALRAIPGVVETGLFVARADLVLVADERGVQRLVRG